MSVELNEKEFEQIQKAFKKIQSQQMLPFFQDVGRRLVNDFKMGFRLSVAPDGEKWKPLKHREGQPLRDTGRLRNSITFQASEKYVEIGTNVVYGRAHQFGVTKQNVPEHTKLINQAFGKKLKFPVYATVKAHTKNPKIPARPFLGIENRQKKKIVQAFVATISKLLEGKADPA